jgi:phosphoglycerate kinase
VVEPVPQLEDLRLHRGTRVLLRADFNTPMRGGKIEDDLRITAALPTIAWLRERDCEIVCCSHLGRPKGKVDPKYSLAPVAKRLAELVGVEVPLASGVADFAAIELSQQLEPGQI